MDYQITSAKAFGNGEGWVQVHDFTPSDSFKFLKRGRLFAVISGNEAIVENEQEVDKVLAGREILTRLHEEYYGKTESTAFNALQQAISGVYEEFKKESLDFEIAALVYLDGVIYSSITKNSLVYLYRKGVLAKILEGKGDRTISISGYPKAGDIVVLGTGDFGKKINPVQLKQAFSKESISDVAEMVTPNIRSLEEGGRTGAVFIKFNEKERSEFVSGFSSKTPQEVKEIDVEQRGIKNEYPNKHSLKEKIISILPKRDIRIRGGEIDEGISKRRKVAVSVGFILIILLLVSIFFGIKTKKEKDKKALFEDTIDEATHQLEEAVSLYELNPVRSRELFNQSKSKVENLLGEGVTYPEVYDLQNKISENESRILGEYNIDPELFLDLTLLSEGFFGDSLSASEDLMVVLDTQNKRLVSIELKSKRTEIVAGGDELSDPKETAVYAGRFFVLDGDTVYELVGEEKEIVEEGFGGNDLISSFAGNIYVLSKANSQIWRVSGSKSEFLGKSEWLSEGSEPDFDNAVSWSIDGNIWVLVEGGEILRFSLGNEINFEMEGVFPPVDSGVSIFTDEDSNYLYVLEPEENRIVVLDKEGEYVAQYISDKFAEGKSIVVSENIKKAIVLTGEKLLSIELKHIQD